MTEGYVILLHVDAFESRFKHTHPQVYYNYISPDGQRYRSFVAAKKKADSYKSKKNKIRVGPGYEVATCDPSFQGVWEGDYEPCIVDGLRGNTVSITCVNDRLQIEVHRRFVRKSADYEESRKRVITTTSTTTTKKKKMMTKKIQRKSKRDMTKQVRIVCTGLTRDEMREVLRLCGRLEHVKIVSDFNRTCPPTHVLTKCDEDRYARRM